jgi:hypothetical protein
MKQLPRKFTARRSRNQIFLDCGGKRSATPLWKLGPQSKSGAAACRFAFLASLFVRIVTHTSIFQSNNRQPL